jgi:uncharacterized membrane protein YeaQ/YmgE (transglycosylase-associated protein family)
MVGHLIAWILVGLIAGAVAGKVVAGSGFGFVGGIILHAITGSDAAASFVGEVIVASLGACILLVVLRAFGRGTRGGTGVTAAFRR